MIVTMPSCSDGACAWMSCHECSIRDMSESSSREVSQTEISTDSWLFSANNMTPRWHLNNT